MEGMINRTVYTINPNFRLQSNHLLVEWIMIDTFTFQQELLQCESAFIYNKERIRLFAKDMGIVCTSFMQRLLSGKTGLCCQDYWSAIHCSAGYKPRRKCFRIQSNIWTFTYGDCRFCFSIISLRAFSLHWATVKHRLCFWQFLRFPILRWISCL